MLQLSPHVLPQVRNGALRLTPLNLSVHPERVAYTRNLVTHLERLVALAVRGDITRAAVDAFHEQAHLGAMIATIEWDASGGPRVVPWPHAAAFVSCEPEQLGVMFLDGRLRDERAMLYLQTGLATPAFAAFVAALARGGTADELLAIARAHGLEIGAELLASLVERGVLDEIADPAARVPARFTGTGDRVTWLGQNGIVFQSGATTVWFDPLVPPRIRYTADELPAAFAPELAAAQYLPPPYGPACEQLTIGELPRPDAVVISHEDVALFDLGLLMCIPRDVPIVVPCASAERPWQVDMHEVLARVLGDRPVVALAHGETYTVGNVRITATPHPGEWPRALPTDWNCHVVHGREASLVLGVCSSVTADAAAQIVEQLGARGRRAILFGFDLYAGEHEVMGFREAPHVFQAPARAWPWFLRIDQLFEPNPPLGISAATLAGIGAATGLARYFPYGFGGAPWLTFQVPHVHRHYISNLTLAQHDRQVAVARSIGFNVPPLQIGVPWAL